MSMSARLGKPSKTDSGAEATRAKLTIRRNVLQHIEGETHVFDAFAGEGHMFRGVWGEATSYTGCDTRFFGADSRRCFVANNVRVMRCIDLTRFNVVDLDSYGSPWEQVLILAARRPIAPGERFGLVITEGQGLTMRLGGTSRAFAQLAGIAMNMPGMNRERHALVDRAVLRTARLMRTTILKRWESTRTRKGSDMRHIGLVLEGLPLANLTEIAA